MQCIYRVSGIDATKNHKNDKYNTDPESSSSSYSSSSSSSSSSSPLTLKVIAFYDKSPTSRVSSGAGSGRLPRRSDATSSVMRGVVSHSVAGSAAAATGQAGDDDID
jgi:hypothetical protein